MKNSSLWPELLTAAFVAFSGFVELHIWSPAYTYFLVMVLVGMDLATDVLLGKRRYSKLVLLILPAYTVVMGFAHGFGREPGLVWLPQGVLILIVVIHLRSLIRNFGKLQLMDGDVVSVMDASLTKRSEHTTKLLEGKAEVEPVEVAEDEAVPA